MRFSEGPWHFAGATIEKYRSPANDYYVIIHGDNNIDVHFVGDDYDNGLIRYYVEEYDKAHTGPFLGVPELYAIPHEDLDEVARHAPRGTILRVRARRSCLDNWTEIFIIRLDGGRWMDLASHLQYDDHNIFGLQEGVEVIVEVIDAKF